MADITPSNSSAKFANTLQAASLLSKSLRELGLFSLRHVLSTALCSVRLLMFSKWVFILSTMNPIVRAQQ